MPPHVRYGKATELLCGEEGVDWQPDVDGNPDRCDAGLFDPSNGAAVTVTTFNNEPATPNENLFLARSVFATPGGELRFLGPDYDVKPGEAYLMAMAPGYEDRVFLPPTW